jgi:hypothetical protein
MLGGNRMINVEIDQEQLKELYLQKVEEHLQEIELEVFFMDSKQLAAYLNMSGLSTLN